MSETYDHLNYTFDLFHATLEFLVKTALTFNLLLTVRNAKVWNDNFRRKISIGLGGK